MYYNRVIHIALARQPLCLDNQQLFIKYITVNCKTSKPGNLFLWEKFYPKIFNNEKWDLQIHLFFLTSFQANGLAPADLNGLEQACAASDDDNDEDKTTDKIVLDGVPVEESLFEDDVDDLELEELEIVE